MKQINFLGSPVASTDQNEIFQWMETRIKTRQASAIAVVNANKFWQMSKDRGLRDFVQNADLVLPEWAVYWGAKQLGTPLKSYIPGVAVLQAAMPWAEEKGYRPYFLGARPQVIEALSKRLLSDFPNLKPAGFHHGYLKTPTEQEMVRNEISKSSPDLIFVAMGSPQQEFWIAENAKKLNIPIAMGVGGSFDVLAGIKKDTPSWARGNGLEWLYRLSLEPKAYWKRYLICNPWFVAQVFNASWQRKNR